MKRNIKFLGGPLDGKSGQFELPDHVNGSKGKMKVNPEGRMKIKGAGEYNLEGETARYIDARCKAIPSNN